MSPRGRALTQFAALVGVLVALALLFPRVLRFVEMAALELRYAWWLILLVGLGAWLVWGVGRKRG